MLLPLEAIVVGGSAGALEALGAILPFFPAGFSLPIAIVLHVPPGKPSYLADVLRAKCALKVKEAEDKEPIAPGTIYLAPPNYHLLVERERCFSLSVDEPVYYSRPSIDVLFESAAAAYGAGLAGVLLSGASEDGARGLALIERVGGTAVVQAPLTAVARTMPAAGLRLLREPSAFPLAEIGPFLAALGRRRLNAEAR